MLPPVKTLYGKSSKKPRLQTILEENIVEEANILNGANGGKREELKNLLTEFQLTLTKRDFLLAFEINRFMENL